MFSFKEYLYLFCFDEAEDGYAYIGLYKTGSGNNERSN